MYVKSMSCMHHCIQCTELYVEDLEVILLIVGGHYHNICYIDTPTTGGFHPTCTPLYAIKWAYTLINCKLLVYMYMYACA